MASYVLSGTGIQALSANVTALHVSIMTPPLGIGVGKANPANYYGVALLRFGDAVGWFPAQPIDAQDQWIGLWNGVTRMGYAILNGAILDVAEVIGGVYPFEGPSGPAGVAGPAGPAGPAGAAGAAGASGGLAAVLHDETLAASGVFDVSGIDQTYTHLMCDLYLRGETLATTTVPRLQVNNDSGANYSDVDLSRIGATSGGDNHNSAQTSISMGQVPASTPAADLFGFIRLLLPFYRAGHFKVIRFDVANPTTSGNNPMFYSGGAFWASNAAINRVKVSSSVGNYVAGSRLVIWGV